MFSAQGTITGGAGEQHLGERQEQSNYSQRHHQNLQSETWSPE
jgi:hypothetical protein